MDKATMNTQETAKLSVELLDLIRERRLSYPESMLACGVALAELATMTAHPDDKSVIKTSIQDLITRIVNHNGLQASPLNFEAMDMDLDPDADLPRVLRRPVPR
ncbi:MAG: hypothetical protein ACR2OW_03835 [Methyloligellaceae bacterium]